MSMIFTTCIYHVCQLLYYSIVHTLYIHGTDVSVHVYARWSGFQMGQFKFRRLPSPSANPVTIMTLLYAIMTVS